VMIIDWSPVIAYFKAGSCSSLYIKSVEPVCDDTIDELLAQVMVLQFLSPVNDDKLSNSSNSHTCNRKQ